MKDTKVPLTILTRIQDKSVHPLSIQAIHKEIGFDESKVVEIDPKTVTTREHQIEWSFQFESTTQSGHFFVPIIHCLPIKLLKIYLLKLANNKLAENSFWVDCKYPFSRTCMMSRDLSVFQSTSSDHDHLECSFPSAVWQIWASESAFDEHVRP